MTPISRATAVLVMMAVVVAVVAAAAKAQAPAPAPATSDGQISDLFFIIFHRFFLRVHFLFLGGIADAGSLLWKQCTMQLRCLRRRTQPVSLIMVSS
jgi:hypothetical protein